MADFPIFSRFATWPPYAGYGDWTLLPTESDVPGSKDKRIPEDQLPASQYAIRYNPLSDEVDIAAWAFPFGVGLTFAAGFGYTSIATINASYKMWLSNGEKNAAMFDVTGSLNGEPQRFGSFPPTFDYSIGDQFKECVHYGISGTFLVYVETTGRIHFITMNSFYGYMEYISRARMKGFRLTTGDITSVSYVSGMGSKGNWTYKLTTTLRNDIIDSIDVSSDSVFMKIAKVDQKGFFESIQSGIIVKKIEGQTIYVEAPSPSDPTKDVPEGWRGGYFEISPTIIIRDPLTLYCDRTVSGSNIKDNLYVKETSLGYETREQQIQDGGNIIGIYVSKDQINSYLNDKLSDKLISMVDYKKYTDLLKYVEGDSVKQIPEEGLIYASFEEGVWGKALLSYVKEIGANQITLHVGIGGGTTLRHNMHAGCLSGEFFTHKETNSTQTYRVARHTRKNIYQIDVRSRTSKDNLIDVLLASKEVKDYAFSVETCRMWFINDLTFGIGSTPSCNCAAFWGHIASSSPVNSGTVITLTIDDSFRGYSTVDELYNRFVQEVPVSKSFLQKWNKNNRGWYLNEENGSSYKVLDIRKSATDKSFDVLIEGVLSNTTNFSEGKKWWISFDKKFEISGGYSYINAPYIAIEGALGGKDDTGRFINNIVIHGIYTGLPLREKLNDGLVFSMVFENAAIYPNIGLEPIVYISTASKGVNLSMCLNKFTNVKGIAYTRNNDPLMSLVVRRGTINYVHDISEHLVYYGGPNKVECQSSGSAGSDQNVDIGQYTKENVMSGMTCLINSSNDSKAVQRQLVVWELKHGNYIMGYPSTSGIVSTIYTRSDSGKPTEELDFVTDYKSGTIISNSEVNYTFASNVDNQDVGSGNVLTISPKKNSSKSPALGAVKVHFVPKENVVNNCTSPYVYPLNNHLDCIVYVKNQTWVRSSAGSGSFKISGYDKVLEGKNLTSRNFDPVNQIDEGQDGLFVLSTFDYSTYSSGLFTAPKSPSQFNKLSDFTTITKDDLYSFPLLLVPNITRCAYDYDEDNLFVVGYSNMRFSKSSSDFGVLSLTCYRLNLLDLHAYPVYAVKGNGGYVFNYCNYNPDYKRIVVAGDAYQEFPEDSAIVVDSNLTTGPLAVAVDEKAAIIVSRQASGFVFFLSDDHGSSWSYIDDISLVNVSGTAGSPSVKIYNDNLWLMFTIGSSLYLKVISMGQLISLARYCKNKKSSLVQDTAYKNLKNNVQDVLNSGKVTFIAEISDQQVSFDVDKEGGLHIVCYNSVGVKGIGSLDHGVSWDYKPVNF